MILGVTGSRDGMNDVQLSKLIEFLNDHNIIELHHGDCVGVDKICFEQASKREVKTISHPPNKDRLRAFCKNDEIRQIKDYIQRNRDIVDECDYLIAFPNTNQEIIRSGTWATIRYARICDRELKIFYPDGRVDN